MSRQLLRFRSSGPANLKMPSGYDRNSRRKQLDLIRQLNQRHLDRFGGHSELEARIRSYESAFRMQVAAPEAFDISQESEQTHKLYGLDQDDMGEYGTVCLLARRMVERGVRFMKPSLKTNHESNESHQCRQFIV